jgi:hypothetical protein
MNFDIALQLIFALSFIGMVCFVLKKTPQVAVLSEKDHFLNDISNKLNTKIVEARSKLKEKSGSWEDSLHKLLFKTRIMFLKADNKTLDLIKKLKQRSEKRKGVDGYWKDIKTSIKKKNT